MHHGFEEGDTVQLTCGMHGVPSGLETIKEFIGGTIKFKSGYTLTPDTEEWEHIIKPLWEKGDKVTVKDSIDRGKWVGEVLEIKEVGSVCHVVGHPNNCFSPQWLRPAGYKKFKTTLKGETKMGTTGIDSAVAEVYTKTEDAIVVSDEMNLSGFSDEFIKKLFLATNKEEILKEAKARKAKREKDEKERR
jgi:hypothetical protein